MALELKLASTRSSRMGAGPVGDDRRNALDQPGTPAMIRGDFHMAIEGLRPTPQHSNLHISDEVGAWLGVLDRLGLMQDHDRVAETMIADIDNLRSCGLVGEPYIYYPQAITFQGLVDALDNGNFPRHAYPPTDINHRVWEPGVPSERYSYNQLDQLALKELYSDWAPQVRLAVYNTHATPKVDKLLHFLGLPFDEHSGTPGQRTQLEAIDETRAAYHSEHEGFVMTPLNTEAILAIALSRRLRRVKGEAMPVSRAYFRDATLPRLYTDPLQPSQSRRFREPPISLVGMVFSGSKGEMVLDWSRGTPKDDVGVGLAVAAVMNPRTI